MPVSARQRQFTPVNASPSAASTACIRVRDLSLGPARYMQSGRVGTLQGLSGRRAEEGTRLRRNLRRRKRGGGGGGRGWRRRGRGEEEEGGAGEEEEGVGEKEEEEYDDDSGVHRIQASALSHMRKQG